MQAVDGRVVRQLSLEELPLDLLPGDIAPGLLEVKGGVAALGEPVLERALDAQRRQYLPQLPVAVLNLVVATLDGIVDQLLEGAYFTEVALKHTLLVDMSQIGTDGRHLAAEELAVDVLGKAVEVTAVVKEFPVLLLGVTAYHVPLVVLHPLVHLGGHALLAQREQEVVDCHTHGIVLLELDVVVEVAVQLAGKVAQDGLEKRVDGAHVEVTVVEQQLVQRMARQRAHRRLIEAGVLHEFIEVVALDAGLRQAVQLVDDALLHLVGRLVGKGDGQHLAVDVEQARIGVSAVRRQRHAVGADGEQQMPDVFQCKAVGLSRAGRGLDDQQVVWIVAHFSVSVFSWQFSVEVFLLHGAK